jgi:lysophospholipase L1-like esterase
LKNKYTYKVKILLFVFSLALSLTVLELSMRTAGFFLSNNSSLFLEKEYQTDNHYELFQSGHKSINKTIITIGDSFTNGGNLSGNWKENYPYFLSRLLENSTTDFSIINMGLCEDTTLGVYERLKQYLENSDNIKPDYVIALVGSADGFHLKHREHLGKIKFISPKDEIINLQKKWWKNLRIYKMWRHIYFFLEKKLFLSEHDKIFSYAQWKNKDKFLSLYKSNNRKEYISFFYNEIHNISQKYSSEEKLGEKYYQYRNDVEAIIIVMADTLIADNRYDEVLDTLLNIGAKTPELWDIYTYRILVFQTFKKQSIHSAQAILDNISHAESIVKTEDFRHFKKSFMQFALNENKLKLYQKKIWKKIISLSKKYKFKLILQTYPSHYNQINSTLRELADQHGLHLVDQNKSFTSKIKKKNKEFYLRGDDHCTEAGYKLMAKNIFNSIFKPE